MKYLSLIFCFLSAMLFTGCSINSVSENADQSALIIVPISSFQYNFSAQPKHAMSDFVTSNSIVINGGYFDHDDKTSIYAHAGYLSLHGQEVGPIRWDGNITQITEIQDNGMIVHVYEKGDTFRDSSKDNILLGTKVFYTKEGGYQCPHFDMRHHCDGKFLRTFLGNTGAEAFVGISTTPLTMSELTDQIRSRVSDASILINLDGGPSTALAMNGYDFNGSAILPNSIVGKISSTSSLFHIP